MGQQVDQSCRVSAAYSVFSSRHARVIGPTPPGTGVIQPARGECSLVNHVADQLAIVLSIDADVDHDGARLDPFAFDQARFTGGNHHQIGTAHMARQILGEAVG